MEMQIRAVSPPPTLHSGETATVSRFSQTPKNVTRNAPDTVVTNAQKASREQQVAREADPKGISEKFNRLSEEMNLDIKFAYNDKIDQFYINVIDKNSGKVIRKLPSDEAMKIAESMKELVGTLFDKKG